MCARRRHASEQPPKAALSESQCDHWLAMTAKLLVRYTIIYFLFPILTHIWENLNVWDVNFLRGTSYFGKTAL